MSLWQDFRLDLSFECVKFENFHFLPDFWAAKVTVELAEVDMQGKSG